MPDNPGDKKPKGFFGAIIAWVKNLADWVEQNLGDPAIARQIREDLGLRPGEDAPPEGIGGFAKNLDPDKESFDATVAEIGDAVTAILDFAEAIKGDGLTAWDVMFLLGRVSGAQTVQLRYPAVYAIGRILGFISEDPEVVPAIVPDTVVSLLRGEGLPDKFGDRIVDAIARGDTLVATGLIIAADSLFFERVEDQVKLDAAYGWDPAGAAPTEVEKLAGRALTLTVAGTGAAAPKGALTFLGVPREHGGPGVAIAVGGALDTIHESGNTRYHFGFGAPAGATIFVPLSKDARDFDVRGDTSFFVKLFTEPVDRNAPAFRIGEPGRTRLEIGAMGYGLDLDERAARFRLAVQRGAIAISLGEDGFLKHLQAGEIRIGFDLAFVADTDGGVRLEGGSAARTVIPVGESLGGVLKVQQLELDLGPGQGGREIGIEIAGAFGLRLGPFAGTVDRMGLRFDMGLRQGNLGIIDAAIGFKPPSGIGLVLDAGVVKGGGYLYFDPARHEYAGALELKVGPVSVKAIGILATRMPDGSEGWSLLLMIYGQFPPIQLSFGFVLSGIGGLIGLQHGLDLDQLQANMASGVFDDILFPENPVADAPRIINRMRQIAPSTRGALLIGPMVELGWGGVDSFIALRLAIVLQLDNVLAGDRPASFNKIAVLGQVRITFPKKKVAGKAITRIIVDFLGYYDFDRDELGFTARLHDSKIMERLDLFGMMVVRARFGDDPTFILAAGGFGPWPNRPLPAGTPANIERIGLAWNIGIVKVRLETYFAVTPATVEMGARLSASGKVGPVSFDGYLGFDALIQFEPRFAFIVRIEAGVKVKFKGHTLAGVTLSGQLEGPGRWRFAGKASFDILFWSPSIEVDESWGEVPAEERSTVKVGEQVAAALRAADAWSVSPPAEGDSFATLIPAGGPDALVAHPTSTITVLQRVAPFGLDLQRFGNGRIEGAARFSVQRVRIGDADAAFRPARESFARNQYLNLTDEQRVNGQPFDEFDAGASLGSNLFTAPANGIDVELGYETRMMGEAPTGRFLFDPGLVVLAAETRTRLRETVLAGIAIGAAARSPRRVGEALGPVKPVVDVVAPEFTARAAGTLAAMDAPAGMRGFSALTQAFRPGAARVVERFELELGG